MRSELVVLMLATAWVTFVPGGVAQDAGALAAHAEEHGAAVQEDPAGFAANATTPEFHRAEFNFTVSWTCDAAEDTPAREALEELGACETLKDVAAVEDEDEDDEHAHADELDESEEVVADAEGLAEEGADAAAEEAKALAELLDDAAADPLDVVAHVEKFLKKTVEVVGVLLGGLLMLVLAVPAAMLDAVLTAADLLIATVEDVLDGLLGIGSLSLDGVEALFDGVAAALAAVGAALGKAGSAGSHGVADAVIAVGDAVKATADGVTKAVSSTVDALRDLVGGLTGGAKPRVPGSDVGGDAGGAVDDATGLVDGLVDALPL